MRILLLCHAFPPMNVIGAVRPYRMARHFTEAGHEVVVVCADNPGWASNDASDTSGLVVRRVPVPSIVRMLEPNGEVGLLKRGAKSIARQFLYPDTVAPMRSAYVEAARALAAEGFVPQVIVSSAFPFSLHSAARRIAKELRCKWVADNRDVWAASPYRRRPALLRSFDKYYEAKVLNDADLVTAVGKRQARVLSPGLSSKIIVVRNGSDPRPEAFAIDARERKEGAPVSFVYTGILYDGLRDPTPLFRALVAGKIESAIDFYGSEKSRVDRWIKSYPSLKLTAHPHVSKTEVKRVQRAADFLLVILGNTEFEKSVLTGKFFEYVESRRPIIAICDKDGELGELIAEHKLGIATRDQKELEAFVAEQVRLGLPDLPPPPVALSRAFQLQVLENEVSRLVAP